MPFTSTQVSGLVGGQQVMFSNQAAFANQIAGLGDSSQMMANPYPSPSYGVAGLDPGSPDIGTRLAGSAAMTLPALAAGGTMAASMLGYKNPLGLLDPFTAASRGFGAGTGGGIMARTGVMAGAEGMGIRYAMGNISGAFAQGGLRAGLGAIGGGLAGAAVAALPAYIAGSAISYGAGQVYEGVQNFQDVKRMTSQYFQPQYGQPGTRMGGGPSASMVRGVTSFLHEVASEDTMTSMKDMRQLMDNAGSMGMLQGIGDVNQFKERFRNILKQTKGVAQILGTTLSEALPLVNQLQQMGMWTAKDVMGASAAAKVAGPGGVQALMGSMQQGAQMSHAMGGRLESGARLGQELFSQVGAATSSGVFSRQDIRNFTGGVGGVEGQRMVAGGLQQVMAGFGQSAMGRLMMAGLGEMKNGAFTGQMDQQLLEKFNRGEISVGELQSRGQGRINKSQEAAASFFNKEGVLSQEMAQKGGMVGMASGIQQALVRAGRADAPDNIQNRFIQLITGANQRQADMIQKIIKDLPRIQAEEERKTAAALEDSFRQLDERRNKSFAGLSDAIGDSFHEAIGRPLQELGENLTTNMNESMGRLSDKIAGRTRALPRLSMGQRMMLAQAGATEGPQDWGAVGITNVGQSLVEGTTFSNLTARMRTPGGLANIGLGALGGAGYGAAVGSIVPGVGTTIGAVAGGVIGAGAAAFGYGEMTNPAAQALLNAGLTTRKGTAGAGEMDIGEGRVVKLSEAQGVARRAFARSMDPTVGGLLGGETPEKRKDMETVKARLRKIFNTADGVEGLAELREKGNQGDYAKEVIRRLKADPVTAKAMERLSESAPGEAGGVSAEFDITAVAQGELGYGGGKNAIDFSKMASDIPGVPGSLAEVEKAREQNIDKMMEAANGSLGGSIASGAGVAAMFAAATGNPLVALGGALVGGAIGAISHMAGSDIAQGDIESALASDKYTAKDIQQYIKDKSGRFAEAANQGDAAAIKLSKHLDTMSEEQKSKFSEALGTEGLMKQAQFNIERRDRLKTSAAKQGPITSIEGIKNRDLVAGLEKVRGRFLAGDIKSGEAEISRLAKGNLSDQDINTLLLGRGGEGGRQVGREALIGKMGEMDEEQWNKFRQRLNMGGVDLTAASGVSERINEMLADKKIRGGEVTELRKLLGSVAPAALGQGPGTKSSAEDVQQKYISAMENFTEAVRKIAVVDKKDVQSENGLVLATSEGG